MILLKFSEDKFLKSSLTKMEKHIYKTYKKISKEYGIPYGFTTHLEFKKENEYRFIIKFYRKESNHWYETVAIKEIDKCDIPQAILDSLDDKKENDITDFFKEATEEKYIKILEEE